MAKKEQIDMSNQPDSSEGDLDLCDGNSEEDVYRTEGVAEMMIRNVASLSARGVRYIHGPETWACGMRWRIRVQFADVNRSRRQFGFFLQCIPGPEALEDWSCRARAKLTMVSQRTDVHNFVCCCAHNFCAAEDDWGFQEFCLLDKVLNPVHGYLKDDTLLLSAQFTADPPRGVPWDSKKITGCVGLVNEGATCYLNSLLQAFFFTNQLRKAVYQIPTESGDGDKSVALAMQRVFYGLQHSDKPVETNKLTESFGWDSFEKFRQHDVQELCRVLLSNLEGKMATTLVRDTIRDLFEGKTKSFVRCKNVDFESSRFESFYDLQLNVAGKENLMESFADYTEVETLDGENMYDAGDLGLQPAVKGVKFVSFPPVLYLQLMRFYYDPEPRANAKINDRFEFPSVLNLNEFVDGGDEKDSNEFLLQAVFVHSGTVRCGHYVVFINTNLGGAPKWCKFDDDVVSVVSMENAIDENFGGESFANAYMLVYVKKSSIGSVLCAVEESDIPDHLHRRFSEENEVERKKKKDAIDRLANIDITVITESQMNGYDGFDLFDDEIVEKSRRFSFNKYHTVFELYKRLAEEFCLGMDTFRVWLVKKFPLRDNKKLLTSMRPMTMWCVRELIFSKVGEIIGGSACVLFLEVSDGFTFTPLGAPALLPKYDKNTDILCFLKYYDCDLRRVIRMGHIVMKFGTEISSYAQELLARAGLEPGTELRFYEELSAEKRCLVSADGGLSVHADGAILIYERADRVTEDNNADAFYQNRFSVVLVEAVQHPDSFGVPPEEQLPTFDGEISLQWSITGVMQWIAGEIGCNFDCILLWKVNIYDETTPRNDFVGEEDSVADFLGFSRFNSHDPRDAKRHRIFYTKMPFPVSEMSSRCALRLQCLYEKFQISETVVFPERRATVQSVLEDVARVFHFSPNGTKVLRMLWVGQTAQNMRIHQQIANDLSAAELCNKISAFNHSIFSIRVEEVPEDELTISPDEMLVPVAHFDKIPRCMFGVPFFVKLRNGETMKAVAERIRNKLDVCERDFEEYKLAVVLNARVERYLSTEDIVNIDHFHRTHILDLFYLSKPWLGLDHRNKDCRLSDSRSPEKPIVIHN